MTDEIDTTVKPPRFADKARRVLLQQRERVRDDARRTEIDKALKQLEALDAAWEENEKRGNRFDSINLAKLQNEYCRLADVPLYGLDNP